MLHLSMMTGTWSLLPQISCSRKQNHVPPRNLNNLKQMSPWGWLGFLCVQVDSKNHFCWFVHCPSELVWLSKSLKNFHAHLSQKYSCVPQLQLLAWCLWPDHTDGEDELESFLSKKKHNYYNTFNKSISILGCTENPCFSFDLCTLCGVLVGIL